MNKYFNSKIYKIIDNTNNNIYIGSTCQELNVRLSEHKYRYKQFLKGLANSLSSFEILKNNDYKIELIENIQCNNVKELKQKERYYIDNIMCVNIQKPLRTPKEYYETNKDIINKKRNERKLCECGKYYTSQNYNRHLQSRNHIKII